MISFQIVVDFSTLFILIGATIGMYWTASRLIFSPNPKEDTNE